MAGLPWLNTLFVVVVSGCRSVCDPVPGWCSPLILADDTCQPLLVCKRVETSNGDETRVTVYVCPQIVWVWVRKLFAGSLFQVELSSSKSRRALHPGSFLVLHARQVFLRVFLFPRLSPYHPTTILASAGYSPSTSAEKTPYDIPYALFDATRNDSACTHPHSCLPVIYLLSFRHSSYCHSHSSPSSLEQAGGTGTSSLVCLSSWYDC